MELTYEDIAPLIVNQEIEGRKMIVEFETPSGEIVSSSATIKADNSIQGKLAKETTRMAKRQVRRMGSRLVRQALGGGMIGRMGSRVVRSTTRESMRGSVYFSESDKQEAIVNAFKRVQSKFVEGQDSQKKEKRVKISRKELKDRPPLEMQLEKHPVENAYDREILARMLAELAQVDGQVTSDEKAFLMDSLGRDSSSMDDLMNMDKISRVECEEVSEKVKPSIYMLAWVMSLIDMDLHPEEEQLLLDYADMFAFSDRQFKECVKAAQYYIIEGSCDANSSRDELFIVSDAIGMEREEAERCLIQMKKRG